MRKRTARVLRRIADRLDSPVPPGIDLQVFREDGTWKRPWGGTGVTVYAEGAQGGGPDGPGRDGLTVVACLVPGRWLPSAILGDEEQVTVGKGGAGGMPGGSGRFTPEEVRARQAEKPRRRREPNGPITCGGGGYIPSGDSQVFVATGGAWQDVNHSGGGDSRNRGGGGGGVRTPPPKGATVHEDGSWSLTLAGGKGGVGGRAGVNGGRGGDGQPGETVTGQFS